MNDNKELFSMIAVGLASNYDVIYYVDPFSGSYSGYTVNSIYGSFIVREEGDDFFSECKKNIDQVVFPDDRDRIRDILRKDYLISALEDKKQLTADYRLVIDDRVQYTRLTVMWARDKAHFIIAVQNVDEEIRKEKEQIQALRQANELARRDELTGTRNRTIISVPRAALSAKHSHTVRYSGSAEMNSRYSSAAAAISRSRHCLTD